MQSYLMLMSLLVVGLGIGVIRNSVPLCNPGISEGSHSKLEIGGHTSLECEMSSCDQISKIIFEKNDPSSPTQWTPVYEGANKSFYHALDMDDNYTLKHRTEYAPFPTQHILYINHLTLEDHGKWRCIVFDMDNRRAESQVINLYFAPVCNPGISKGSHSKLEIGGHTSLECEISTCVKVSKIIFEKNDVLSPTQWTPVYEGANKSFYHALDVNDNYTLKDRAEYAPFPTQHILYINDLRMQDKGKWRCIVFDKHNRRAESPVMSIFYGNSIKETEIIKPSIVGVKTKNTVEFSCEVSVDYPKHSFIWTVNETEYSHGKSVTHESIDGLLTVQNNIAFQFDHVGAVTIGCKMDSLESTDDLKWNSITIYVTESQTTTTVTEMPSTQQQPTRIQENDIKTGSVIGYIVGLAILVIVVIALSILVVILERARRTGKQTSGRKGKQRNGLVVNMETLENQGVQLSLLRLETNSIPLDSDAQNQDELNTIN